MTDDELHSALCRLYETRELYLKENFNRSLPFADAILDNRWKRARRLGFGEGASIYDSALVYGDVSVGAQTWVGPSVILDGSGGNIKIGAFCSIAAGVHIYTHDTVLWALAGGKAPPRRAEVQVGDCCYIGAQSIILPGVIIGRQSVIAANSLVNREVDPYTVMAGSPARAVGRVEGEGAAVRIVMDSAAVGTGRNDE
jgi:acetyltransferase-like isoleucine patch superfamily enzyme